MSPNFRKMNGCSGIGSPPLPPQQCQGKQQWDSPPPEALNQWSTHPSSMWIDGWMRLSFTQLLPSQTQKQQPAT